MARLELNEDEMFQIAKSILKPQEKSKKLYFEKNKYKPVVAAEKPGPSHKWVSTSYRQYMFNDRLERDYEHVIAFFENPADPNAPTRDQVRRALNQLRDEVTQYFKEPYYYCDHDIQTVEGKENGEVVKIEECAHCGFQPEEVEE